MKYKLLKKLKKVGFPFRSASIKKGIEEIRVAIPTTKKITKWLDTNEHVVQFGEGYDIEWYFVPTLEELMGACGNKFENLVRMDVEDIGVWYQAYMTENAFNKIDDYVCVRDCCGYETGDTEFEAMVKLWLILKNYKIIK